MSVIGWIGLGKMGEPMARRLRAAGYGLQVYNRSMDKSHRLVAEGARLASSPADAAKGAGTVFVMVADDAALRQTVLGPNGALASMDRGATVVEMSTVSPEVSEEVAAMAAERGVGYLRAPVSGSVAFAESGKLTVLASGPQAVYKATLPLLAHLSARQFHVGEGCQARVLKLAINMMVGMSAAMVGEALALGQAYGLDRSKVLEVMGASAVASPLIGYKLEMLRTRDYAPAFEARMMAKDFDLVLDAAHDAATPMPLAAQVREGWSALIAAGDGDEDFFKYAELAARAAGQSGA